MKSKQQKTDPSVDARRKFLKNAGKFAVATPPAVSLLLASAKGNYANAISGNGGGKGRGPQGNNGFGNGGGDGVPGRSGKQDRTR